MNNLAQTEILLQKLHLVTRLKIPSDLSLVFGANYV
jgi:hypothetical protein